jgi:phosphoserine phosphatase RsbU/P
MPDPTLSAPELPAPVRDVLDAFRRCGDGEVRLWVHWSGRWVCVYPAPGEEGEPAAGAVAVPAAVGVEMRLDVLRAGSETAKGEPRAAVLAAAVGALLRQDSEIRFFSGELAERYEEITLLYSISETLGAVLSLEEAAGTILEEVVGTLGSKRAALWLHDAETGLLELVAAVGGDGQRGPIRVSDHLSVTAKVFRDRAPMILEPEEEFPRGAASFPRTRRRGSFLSVPVSYSPPDGATRTIGVINLIGRVNDEPYSAGDQKLLSAIASQVGAAVENSRLVAETLQRQRLVHEVELAHDLQMKLLPSLEPFRGYAEVAARCLPAESVGGDFYHLFRLPGGRLGVMIGDVSSHGFGAALIMALTMSAVAIHASEGDPPLEVLRRVHRAIAEELETTEMHLALFYGVIDPGEGRLVYANAGHPHAFRISGGAAERLGSTSTPLGICLEEQLAEAEVGWIGGEDALLLFTDGLSDALGIGEVAGEKRILSGAVARAHDAPDAVLDALFRMGEGGEGGVQDDRTAVFVRV